LWGWGWGRLRETEDAKPIAPILKFEDTDTYKELSAKLAAARDRLGSHKAGGPARLAVDPQYKQLTAKTNAASEKLQKARLNGTPQERINASSEYGTAKKALDAFVAAFNSKPDDAARLDAEVSRLESEITKARGEHRRQQAESLLREMPPKIRSLMEKRDKERKFMIPFLLERIQSQYSLLLTFREKKFDDYQAKRDLQETIQDLENLLSSTAASIPGLPTPSVGTIGRLTKAKVTQVVDETNALVSRSEETLWVANVSTAGIVDGRDLDDNLIVEVVGTRRYKTVAGATNTVFVLKPLQISEYLLAWDEIVFLDRAEMKRRIAELREKLQ
jgi:hypothetical protein